MNFLCKKVDQLIKEDVLFPPIDGNHGEKHPKTSDFVDEGIPFIIVPDLKDGLVDLQNCNYISKSQANTLSKGFSKTGDVLFTHKGTIGKVAIVDTGKYDYIILTPQVTYYRIKNPKVLSNRYLYCYFRSQTFQNTFRLFASSGGTRDYLGIVAQQKLPIIYPDIKYQVRIADVIQNYDRLIYINNKRIKVLEQMAENLYKEWFVRFRFPGHETAEFENGIPKGWEYCRLFDIANITYGYSFSSEEFCDDESLNAVVRIRDVPNNATKTYTAEECDDKYLIKENAILVGMDGIFHMCLWNGKRAFLNQRVVEIESKQKNVCNFLLFLAIAPQIKFWEQVISGTTVAHLGDKHLKRISVLIPNETTLNKTNAVFESIMIEKNNLFKQNEALIRQRDLLLPRLMSGKLEV